MHNAEKEYTEADWKKFRARIGQWQENYMEKLNQEYIKILSQDKNPSEKFWQLEKRIRSDKRKPGVVIDIRRSTMFINVLDLIRDGVITLDDIADFSEGFKERVEFIINRPIF